MKIILTYFTNLNFVSPTTAHAQCIFFSIKIPQLDLKETKNKIFALIKVSEVAI